MAMFGKSPYTCPECDGSGEIECVACGADCECDHCEGTGWDSDQVDVRAFLAAERALHQTMREAGLSILTHEWIDDGTRLGRDGGEYGRVAVADYLIDKKGRDS